MTKRMKHEDFDFSAFVQVFNTQGKTRAQEYVQEKYQISYPSFVKHLRNGSDYYYSFSTKKYELRELKNDPFLSMEELENKKIDHVKEQEEGFPSHHTGSEASFPQNDHGMLLHLLKDNMQEINKYICLEQSSKKIIIDLKKVEYEGYRIIIQ